jgi:cysteine desulfurase
MNVYLDNAATTQLHPQVLEEMLPFLTEIFGNPSSSHSFGRKSKAAIESARKTIASAINAGPLEIVFTSGGTEANNMAIKCAVETYGVKHIVSSVAEHKCVFNTCHDVAESNKLQLHLLKVNQQGFIDSSELENLLASLEGKVLVTLIHANNELGTITNIKAVGELCRKYDALFHSDTVQTICHYPIDVQDLHIHFLSGSAHKFHGPKGVGFLFMKKDAKIKPLIHGGGQERNYRSGTENVSGIVGMAKALSIAYENLEIDKKHILEIKNYFIEKLQSNIKEIAFNGDVINGLYTVLNVSFPPQFNSDMLLFSLDIAGVAASGGSACSSGASTGSHVLDAIGHPLNRKAIRFSFSKYNTKEEIDYVVEQLLKLGK